MAVMTCESQRTANDNQSQKIAKSSMLHPLWQTTALRTVLQTKLHWPDDFQKCEDTIVTFILARMRKATKPAWPISTISPFVIRVVELGTCRRRQDGICTIRRPSHRTVSRAGAHSGATFNRTAAPVDTGDRAGSVFYAGTKNADPLMQSPRPRQR